MDLESIVVKLQECEGRSSELWEELCSGTEKLVYKMAHKFNSPQRKTEFDELVQVARVGFVKAVYAYDQEKGVKFTTYACSRMEGELLHYFRDHSKTIRTPRWLRRLSGKVAQYLEIHQQKHNALPTSEEIAKALNISVEGVVEVLNYQEVTSIEGMADQRGLAMDKIRSLRYESFSLPLEDRIALSQALDNLLDIEKSIVLRVIVGDFSQKEVASEMGLHPRKVSRVLAKALKKLRDSIDL